METPEIIGGIRKMSPKKVSKGKGKANPVTGREGP
jgi:hypothetical protein